MYSWRFIEDKTRNIGVHEISRGIEGEEPFTVVITNYKKEGDRMLFNDLFWTKAWDPYRGKDEKVSKDVEFCIRLWKHLGLPGEFSNEKIEHDLFRFPIVYRRKIETVMYSRFGVKTLNNLSEIND